MTNTSELYELIGEAARLKTTGQWLEFCDEVSIPAAAVLDLAKFHEDPHLSEVGLVEVMNHPTEGDYRYVKDPVIYSETSTGLHRHAPRLGQHSIELLRELGYDEAKISKMVSEGIVTVSS